MFHRKHYRRRMQPIQSLKRKTFAHEQCDTIVYAHFTHIIVHSSKYNRKQYQQKKKHKKNKPDEINNVNGHRHQTTKLVHLTGLSNFYSVLSNSNSI